MTRRGFHCFALLAICNLNGYVALADSDTSPWQAGMMLDMGYAVNPNNPDINRWRTKLTSTYLNQFAPNMGVAYVRKNQDAESPLGLELAVQGGHDTEAQVPQQQRLPGYSVLRYIGRANVSYRLPIGSGLNLTGGLLNSFIGSESIYARDNAHITRTWMADFSPYYLIGVGAQYALSDTVQIAGYLLTDYDYLAYRSAQPKYAGQWVWSPNTVWTVTENWFAGSEQGSDPAGWRYFSDTVVNWRQDNWSVTWSGDVGTQLNDNQQANWLASMASARWQLRPEWALALRPELYWDQRGLMTGQAQFIKALTATLEYKHRFQGFTDLWRMEYRYDNAQGHQAGFFQNSEQSLLNTHQQLILFSCTLSFDSQ